MQNDERTRSRRRAWLRRIGIYSLIYLLLCGVLFVFQRRLLYPADRRDVPFTPRVAAAGVREVALTTADGLQIYAWYAAGRRPGTIVLFHGNGGHRGHRLDWLELLSAQGAGVFLIDYRGYGGSEGSPSEDGLYLDGEAAIAWVHEHAPGPLVLMGESLGNGVAVEMARRHEPAGLILHASYTSMVDVARSQFFFVPVGWLLLDRFENAEKIGEVRCPKLFFHGTEDGIIPYRHGQGLFVRAAEPKRWVEVPGAGHNDLYFHDVTRYFGAVREFLDEVLPVDE